MVLQKDYYPKKLTVFSYKNYINGAEPHDSCVAFYQDPGRIFPGKKMAGVVGGKNSTTPPLKVSDS